MEQHYPHFAAEETEVERGNLACLNRGPGWELNLGLFLWPLPHVLLQRGLIAVWRLVMT